jgi:hypothetical protein
MENIVQQIIFLNNQLLCNGCWKIRIKRVEKNESFHHLKIELDMVLILVASERQQNHLKLSVHIRNVIKHKNKCAIHVGSW